MPRSNTRVEFHCVYEIGGVTGSPLFDDLLTIIALKAPLVVNGKIYEKGYYLADGIYP